MAVDSQPGFDVAALEEWIGDRLPGRGLPLRADRMGEGTGEANALYWLGRGKHVWVLRRPPAVINAPGASSPRDTRRLAAVVDWDTGTIGDPLLDVGHLLARWTEPGEEPAIGVWDIEVRDGLPSRAELAARYADRTGADLSALPYYQALALFKLTIILEGSVPPRRGPEAESRAAMVDRLIRYAGLFAREERAAAKAAAR